MLVTDCARTARQAASLSANVNSRCLTVVLVHGAFENSSIWNDVIPAILQRDGIKVVATQNPLTSLTADVASTDRTINDQEGDVVLVGHSYGGAVISEAGNNRKVKAFVCVAAVPPNSGESGLDEAAPYPKPAWLNHLFVDKQAMAYATPRGIDDLEQDVPARKRRVLPVTQGPTAFAAFQGKCPTRRGGPNLPGQSWRMTTMTMVIACGSHIAQPRARV